MTVSTKNQSQITTYTFDANGDLSSFAGPAPTVNYAWDCADRLVAITNGSTVTTFLYDGMGNRIGRIIGTTTNYFALNYNDGLKNVLAEVNGTGAVTRYYVWGPAGLVCDIDVVGTTTHYYHADEQGSTLALTDGSGNVSDEFAYQPYGALSTRTGTTPTPYQWLGGLAVRVESNDTYATAHRFYSADQKRFLSADPAGIDGGANLYAYGSLNPAVYADPYGLCAESDMDYQMRVFGEVAAQTQARVYTSPGGSASGLDALQTGLAVASIVDPTPITPTINTLISIGRGNATAAGISIVAMIPLVGEEARLGIAADRLGLDALEAAGQAAAGAADTAANVPATLYHYTSEAGAAGILKKGILPGASGKIFTTTASDLSPLQAQIELAMSPNRGLPRAMLQIDAAGLEQVGIKPLMGPLRVQPTINAPGGGTEVIFNQQIPPQFIKRVR